MASSEHGPRRRERRTGPRDETRQERGGPQRLPSARELAVQVLERVASDGAYAVAALDAALARHPQLDGRERALATELAYGVLRTGPALEARLAALAPKGVARGDQRVRHELLVAAYQLLLLDRVPPHAAVDAAVGAVRAVRGKSVAGFANAVLRRLAATRGTLDYAGAVEQSAPGWLRERLVAVVGADEARALLGASPEGRARTGSVAVRLVAERAPSWAGEAPPGRVSPRARLLAGVGDPRRLDGYAEGAFTVQEEGAQLVALALGARPGERVLDACAGRGQKTSLLREGVGPGAEVWATDLYPAKLEALERELARLRLAPATTRAIDWTLGAGDVPDGFDRVLVDAPCTGVGTLAGRPEILHRLRPEDPARMGELAAVILRRAASRARPGGRVVFAVCSVLPEECEAVLATLAADLEPVPFDAPELADLVPNTATSLRLLPGRHGTDGYFVASLRRR